MANAAAICSRAPIWARWVQFSAYVIIVFTCNDTKPPRICIGQCAGIRYLAVMKACFARLSSLLLLSTSLGGLPAADAPFTGGKWIDLTHEFSAETLYWPTAQSFTLETEFHGQTLKGYFYCSNRYRASEHGGTHIDAPIHFAEGHPTVDQLPIDQLAGTAVVVDVSDRAQK